MDTRTWALFFWFFLIVIAVGWLFSYIYNSPGILLVAVVFSVGMSVISYWFSDKIALAMARAKPLKRKDNPKLFGLVEQLCQKAGLPMPKVCLVNEAAPNAFATGRDYKHAVVAVTAGLLNQLNSEELEGVIAHELSHIKNRDMLVATVAVVLVGFISILSDIFLRSLFFGGFRRRGEGGAGLVLLAVGILVAILAPLGALLIRLAVSRKREFLADATGAKITKNPKGLASALRKISQRSVEMKVANSSTAHLWISNPFRGKKLGALFMTHPPIDQRIKKLNELSTR